MDGMATHLYPKGIQQLVPYFLCKYNQQQRCCLVKINSQLVNDYLFENLFLKSRLIKPLENALWQVAFKTLNFRMF